MPRDRYARSALRRPARGGARRHRGAARVLSPRGSVAQPDVIYLSTTDYVQYKQAPGTAGANAFYAMLDRHLGALGRLGATVAVTADHGMNGKTDDDGAPRVLYLQEILDGWTGAGTTRGILPITDPYVAHHGSLRSHGGLSEQAVPVLVNRQTPGLAPGNRPRNYDVFEVALNRVA